jgi:hypothetical protein
MLTKRKTGPLSVFIDRESPVGLHDYCSIRSVHLMHFHCTELSDNNIANAFALLASSTACIANRPVCYLLSAGLAALLARQ